MTAQVSDRVELAGETFAVAGVSGHGLFDPAAHGIEPRMISTGCWRGFHCVYRVTGDELHLGELRLGRGSQLGGVPVEPGGVVLGVPAVLEGGELVLRFATHPVAYDGTLLLGADVVDWTYVHMGYAPAWRFARVVELVVVAGRVTEVRDRSAEMAAIREGVKAGARPDPDGDRSDVRGWIARTFRLGYERTFGEPPRPPAP